MELLWLALFGLLFAGYFVLEGYDFGAGMLLPFIGRTPGERQRVVTAIGPFFLGNEVWLVAVAGTMFGAFPLLDGRLLATFYPLFVAVVLAWVIRDVGLWFRRLRDGRVWRAFWDAALVGGSLILALTWGVIAGNLLQGVPIDVDGAVVGGYASFADPYALLCGVTAAALFALHGAIFLTLRLQGKAVARARHAAHVLAAPAAALVLLAVVLGIGSADVRAAVGQPVIAVLLGCAAVAVSVVVGRLQTAGRAGWAFAGTSFLATSPLLLVGAGLYPHLIVSTVDPRFGLTVAEAAAGGATLTMLGAFAAVIFPVMLAYQAWLWWAFRGRVDRHAPVYF